MDGQWPVDLYGFVSLYRIISHRHFSLIVRQPRINSLSERVSSMVLLCPTLICLADSVVELIITRSVVTFCWSGQSALMNQSAFTILAGTIK